MRKNKTTDAAFRCYVADRQSADKAFEGALEYDRISCEALDVLQKLINENMTDKAEPACKEAKDCYFYATKAGFYAGFEMAMDLFTAVKGQKATLSQLQVK